MGVSSIELFCGTIKDSVDSLKEELKLEVKSQVTAALSPISLQLKEQVDSSVRTLSGMIQDCLRQILPVPSVVSLAGAGLTGDVALPVSSNLECSTALDLNVKGEPQPTKKRRTNVQSTSVTSGAQISTDVEIEENFPLISPRLIKGKNAGRGRSRPGLVSKDKSVLTVTDLVPGPASPCGQGSGQAGRVSQVYRRSGTLPSESARDSPVGSSAGTGPSVTVSGPAPDSEVTIPVELSASSGWDFSHTDVPVTRSKGKSSKFGPTRFKSSKTKAVEVVASNTVSNDAVMEGVVSVSGVLASGSGRVHCIYNKIIVFSRLSCFHDRGKNHN